jgi:hypothetical protein
LAERGFPLHALAALLLSLAPMAAPASDEMGTLFYTPEERARMDKLRRGEAVERTPGAAAPASGPQALTGFVQRSDGRTTLWIDGNPVPLATTRSAPKLDPKSVRAYSDDGESVKVERKTAR